jgi:hypothetical protein
MILFPSAAQLQEPAYEDAIERVGEGSVNWTEGTVTATGIGFPPDNVADPARAQIMAERAGFAVALRNLLEVVKGIRVDSEMVVENFMLKSDVILTRVSGFVKGARMIRKKTNPDGSVEVTIEAPLWGDAALLGILADEKKVGAEKINAVPSPEGYTELVVDARGLGVVPALFPTITDEGGRVIYSPEQVNPEDAAKSGMVRYAAAKRKVGHHPSQDRKPDFLLIQEGRKPLKLKALGKDSKNAVNLMISADDAKKIRESDKMADFLRRGRVMIVIDFLIGGSEGRWRPEAWSVVSEH